jgi:hypothetical protein
MTATIRPSSPRTTTSFNPRRYTGEGLRLAIFHTKPHDRLLRPLLAADRLPAPPPIRNALHTIDIHITETIERARLLAKQPENSRQLSRF